jgi:PEGA domain-containing protein
MPTSRYNRSMSEPQAASPVYASVAYVRIPNFEGLPVAEQVANKERLFGRAQDALASVESADRAVLDADDGLAIVLFAEPARALGLCEHIHQQDAFEPLQVGLNFGPLALAANDAEPRVLGDGLGGAAAAARFAEPDRLLVTEGFARALRMSDPARAADLAKAGDFTDTRVRHHVLYAPDPNRSTLRRRRFALYAVGGVAAMLLLGVIARGIYQPILRSRPGTVSLEVRPRGEVYVDGVYHGRIPPLTEVQLPPGPHRVQLRNPGSLTHNVTIEVKPGERMTLAHTFVRAPEPPRRSAPQPQPQPDFWRDLRKKFGA